MTHGWQPIEMPPEGGICVIAYGRKNGRARVNEAVIDRGEWHWTGDNCGCFEGKMENPPTHWQPLPLPPEAA